MLMDQDRSGDVTLCFFFFLQELQLNPNVLFPHSCMILSVLHGLIKLISVYLSRSIRLKRDCSISTRGLIWSRSSRPSIKVNLSILSWFPITAWLDTNENRSKLAFMWWETNIQYKSVIIKHIVKEITAFYSYENNVFFRPKRKQHGTISLLSNPTKQCFILK